MHARRSPRRSSRTAEGTSWIARRRSSSESSRWSHSAQAAAAALWSANGSGSGTARSVTAQPITVNAATGAADLYPGFNGGDVHFTLSNPNPYPVTFDAMTPGAITSSNPACPVNQHHRGGSDRAQYPRRRGSDERRRFDPERRHDDRSCTGRMSGSVVHHRPDPDGRPVLRTPCRYERRWSRSSRPPRSSFCRPTRHSRPSPRPVPEPG